MDLEKTIVDNIPIIKANNFRISQTDDGTVCVSGRYAEHYNHKKTVFGGSLSTALTVSAWGAAMLLVEMHQLAGASFVIKHQEVSFIKPVVYDFSACSVPVPPEAVDVFLESLRSLKKSSLIIESCIRHPDSGRISARFKGEFVAFLPE